MGSAGHGLEPGAAQAVHGLTRDLDRKPRQEQRHPGDVAVVLASLIGAAEDDVVDSLWRQRRPLDQRPDRAGGQVIGTDLR
jgi:hypothetical protein